MPAIDFSRTYAQTGEHAAYRPVRRPPRSAKIQVVNSRLGLDLGDGSPPFVYPIFFASEVESGALPKIDNEMIAHLKAIVADGYNGLYLRDTLGRKWTESAFNWGLWKYDSNDAIVANRWELEEAALVQLDKMIAYALDLGIECICLDNEAYDEILLRHPSQRPLGTYQGRGMDWSSEYEQMAWDVHSRIVLRVSTVTGVRHIDNPRIIWKFNNESGFGDAFTRSTTSSWGGGGAVTWFAKIVDGITDSNGANGYWYTELCNKLAAWRDATYPAWTIPAWGRGSSGVADGVVGFPKRETWANWATGGSPATDKKRIIEFVGATEVAYLTQLLTRMRAANPDCVVYTGTWSYLNPQAHVALPANLRRNTFSETHHYFYDDAGAGPKLGGAITRRSIMNAAWGYVSNGAGWLEAQGAVRAAHTANIASECAQYSPNRWRYQRLYYEMLLACMHGYDIASFHRAQQYSTAQFINDGRYMQGDNSDIASPAARLAARAIAVPLRLQFLSEHPSTFTVQATPSGVADKLVSQAYGGLQGGARMNATFSTDGTANCVFAQRKLFMSIDAANTPTSDYSPIQMTNAALAAGVFLRNTATEKVWVKRPEGAQFVTPYMCGFYDTLRDKTAADAIFTMPMYLSGMVASDPCYVVFLRSDGLWQLFTGPMRLFIQGSDLSDDIVLQGSDYAQHVADALGSHNPPGRSYFMSNDQVQMYYQGAASQGWGSGAASPQLLMMPNAFTLNLDTTFGGALPGTDLEIFGVTRAGLPVRLPSTYNSGTKVWSFNYDGTYPEYTLQPAVSRSSSVRGARGR